MEEYKGIKRDKHPSWSGWYWLSTYCKNKDTKILDNDIVLQDMVKKFHRKQTLKYVTLTICVWALIVCGLHYFKG